MRLCKYKCGCAFMGAVIILFKSKIIKSAYKHMRLYAGYYGTYICWESTIVNTNKSFVRCARAFFSEKVPDNQTLRLSIIVTSLAMVVNNNETKDARKQLKHDSISYSFLKKYFYITAAAVIYFN